MSRSASIASLPRMVEIDNKVPNMSTVVDLNEKCDQTARDHALARHLSGLAQIVEQEPLFKDHLAPTVETVLKFAHANMALLGSFLFGLVYDFYDEVDGTIAVRFVSNLENITILPTGFTRILDSGQRLELSDEVDEEMTLAQVTERFHTPAERLAYDRNLESMEIDKVFHEALEIVSPDKKSVPTQAKVMAGVGFGLGWNLIQDGCRLDHSKVENGVWTMTLSKPEMTFTVTFDFNKVLEYINAIIDKAKQQFED